MKEFKYTITEPEGIHARPAGMLLKKAREYKSKITITSGEKSSDATRLIQVMAMGIKSGIEVTVAAEGDDEEQAIADMKEFFENEL